MGKSRLRNQNSFPDAPCSSVFGGKARKNPASLRHAVLASSGGCRLEGALARAEFLKDNATRTSKCDWLVMDVINTTELKTQTFANGYKISYRNDCELKVIYDDIFTKNTYFSRLRTLSRALLIAEGILVLPSSISRASIRELGL